MSDRQVEPRFKQPRESKAKHDRAKRDWAAFQLEQMRRRVVDRDGGCVVAGEVWVDGEPHVCAGPDELHHRRKRSSLGADSFENLVLTCQQANRDIEDHPEAVRGLYPWLVVREGDEEWHRLGRRR